jgi:hypothetical protein
MAGATLYLFTSGTLGLGGFAVPVPCSRERLRELAHERDPLLVFGHDPENWAHLEHAPAHYD